MDGFWFGTSATLRLLAIILGLGEEGLQYCVWIWRIKYAAKSPITVVRIESCVVAYFAKVLAVGKKPRFGGLFKCKDFWLLGFSAGIKYLLEEDLNPETAASFMFWEVAFSDNG